MSLLQDHLTKEKELFAQQADYPLKEENILDFITASSIRLLEKLGDEVAETIKNYKWQPSLSAQDNLNNLAYGFRSLTNQSTHTDNDNETTRKG